MKRLLVVFVMVAFLAALAPAAWSHHGGDYGRGKYMMGHKMKRVDIPITVTGMTGDSTTFTVDGMAVEGKKGQVMVVRLDKPISGKYNASNDMAYISMGDMESMGMNIRVDTMNNSTMPVAGASAVLGLEDIRVKYHGKDYTLAQFGKMSVYLPDGTVKSFDLEKPVKVLKSKERKTVVWDAYPAFTKAMGDAFEVGASFPADAPPLKLNDYSAALMSSTPVEIGETKTMTERPAE